MVWANAHYDFTVHTAGSGYQFMVKEQKDRF